MSPEIRTDYLGRPVCWECGHTRELHDGTICASGHCVCRAFVAEKPREELPPLSDDEIRAELEGVTV